MARTYRRFASNIRKISFASTRYLSRLPITAVLFLLRRASSLRASASYSALFAPRRAGDWLIGINGSKT